MRQYVVTSSPGDATCTTTALTCRLGVAAGRAYAVTVTPVGPQGATGTPAQATSGVVPAPQADPQPPATAPQTLTTTDGALTTAGAGEEVTLMAAGYLPGSTVTFVVYSTPVALGSAEAGSDGTATLPVALPESLEAGSHSVVAYGVATDGTPRATRMDFSVAAEPSSRPDGAGTDTLAYTGTAPLVPIAVTGGVLLVLGVALARLARRRTAR